MAHARLEEVIFYRPLHEIIADGRLGDFLVVFDGFVVVGLHRGQVRDFEVKFVREAVGFAGAKLAREPAICS